MTLMSRKVAMNLLKSWTWSTACRILSLFALLVGVGIFSIAVIVLPVTAYLYWGPAWTYDLLAATLLGLVLLSR